MHRENRLEADGGLANRISNGAFTLSLLDRPAQRLNRPCSTGGCLATLVNARPATGGKIMSEITKKRFSTSPQIAEPDDAQTPLGLSLLLVVAVSCIFIGLIWDISWHMTIGRDSFWTGAHICIYLGGAIPGMVCGLIAFKTTFYGTRLEREKSVWLWGARAPFGAWVTIWGACAMLTAAPFDDWWHRAYGLDVKIISPPHILLFAGGFAVVIGTMVYLLCNLNRSGERRTLSHYLFVHVAGVVIGMATYLFLSEGWPNHRHSFAYYYIFSSIFPGLLLVASRASRLRWGATAAALSYTLIICLMMWVLPRFAASPKLGPISFPLDHMVSPYFPHLFIVPALLIDLINRKFNWASTTGRAWTLTFASAIIFVITFIAVQWWLAVFLLSPAANNVIFQGDGIWAYYSGNIERHHIFWEPFDLLTGPSLLRILLAGLVSASLGHIIANWMRRVIR